MAKQQHVELTDDIDGTPASETIQYTWQGATYEIDLNAVNAAEFRDAMTPYVSVSRKVGKAQPRKVAARKAPLSRVALPQVAPQKAADFEESAAPEQNDVATDVSGPSRAAPAKRAAAKRTPAKKAPAKKAPAKSPAKKAAKAPAKKSPARKTTTKKTADEK